MRLSKLFIVMFLLGVVLCGSQIALADGNCAEFVIANAGKCWLGFETPVKFGGGWTLSVNGKNLGAQVPGTIQFSYNLNPTPEARDAGVWSLTAYLVSLLSQGRITNGGGIWLLPDKSDTLVFLPAAGCDVHGQNCQNAPTSDKTLVLSGILNIGFATDTPEALRGLAPPTVEMEYSDGTVITVTRRITTRSVRAVIGTSRGLPATRGKTR